MRNPSLGLSFPLRNGIAMDRLRPDIVRFCASRASPACLLRYQKAAAAIHSTNIMHYARSCLMLIQVFDLGRRPRSGRFMTDVSIHFQPLPEPSGSPLVALRVRPALALTPVNGFKDSRRSRHMGAVARDGWVLRGSPSAEHRGPTTLTQRHSLPTASQPLRRTIRRDRKER
jgi:hypothetical protein